MVASWSVKAEIIRGGEISGSIDGPPFHVIARSPTNSGRKSATTSVSPFPETLRKKLTRARQPSRPETQKGTGPFFRLREGARVDDVRLRRRIAGRPCVIIATSGAGYGTIALGSGGLDGWQGGAALHRNESCPMRGSVRAWGSRSSGRVSAQCCGAASDVTAIRGELCPTGCSI